MRFFSVFLAFVVLAGASVASALPISLRNSNGYFVSATGGGGSSIYANSARSGGWSGFDLIDLNGGGLMSGDSVCLKTSRGYFVVAESGGGQVLNANRITCGPWEVFRIYALDNLGRLAGGPLVFPSRVAIRVRSGQWVTVERDGRGSMVATRWVVGPWELFTIDRL